MLIKLIRNLAAPWFHISIWKKKRENGPKQNRNKLILQIEREANKKLKNNDEPTIWTVVCSEPMKTSS